MSRPALDGRYGLLLPPRPLPGAADAPPAAFWGCLRAPQQEAILARLAEGPTRPVLLDVRRGHVRDGAVWLDGQPLSGLRSFFWYGEVDRLPGSYQQELLRTLSRRVPTRPDPARWAIGIDKYRAHLELADAGLPVPELALVDRHSLPALEPLLARWGAALLKPRRGAWGKGVALVSSYSQLRDIVEYLGPRAGGVYLERWVDNDPAGWVSVTTLGGRAMFGYRKQSDRHADLGGGRWKVYDGAEAGGHALSVPLDAGLVALAERAAAALDLPIVGFDIIATADGPLIVDENTSPGNYPALYAEAGRDLVEEFAAMIERCLLEAGA